MQAVPFWKDSTLIATASALFAGAAAVFTGWQAWEARRLRRNTETTSQSQTADSRKSADAAERSASAAEASARIAGRSIEVTQRAWLVVEEVSLLWGTDIPTSSVQFSIRNSGITPAKKITIKINCCLQKQFSPSFPLGVQPTKVAPLGPSNTHPVRLAIDRQEEPDATRFHNMKSQLVLCGYIEYADVFSHRHATRFAYIYDLKLGRFVVADIFNDFLDFADPDPDF